MTASVAYRGGQRGGEEEAGQADKLWQQQQQDGRVLQWGSEKSREGGLLTVPGRIQEGVVTSRTTT